MTIHYETKNRCRNCHSSSLSEIFHIGKMPLAGQYLETDKLASEAILPLTLVVCNDCHLVQLLEVIDAQFYADYRFVGSISTSYRNHLDAVSEDLVTTKGVKNQKIVEIGCNNGYLLERLRDLGNNEVFGFEPALAMKAEWKQRQIQVANTFFNAETFQLSPFTKADVVIARHVLEHVEDIYTFLKSIADIVADDGLVVIEVPDIDSVFTDGQFSNIYHEHLSYFSIETLANVARSHGLELVDIQIVPIHGGSILANFRPTASYGGSVVIESESPVATGMAFAKSQESYFLSLANFIKKDCAIHQRIAGYGAAHRTIVTCAMAGLTSAHIDYLVDQNTHLQGLIAPGSHIPIVGPDKLLSERPDAVVIFATSFEDEIVAQNQAYLDQGGRFISILPTPRYLP